MQKQGFKGEFTEEFLEIIKDKIIKLLKLGFRLRKNPIKLYNSNSEE